MKITTPNGTIIEATTAELLEAHSTIKSADDLLKSMFGDESISLWNYLWSALGFK